MIAQERFISLEQSVIRVLILLFYAGNETVEGGFTRCIGSNVKLQKMDFLLRNADYLRQMLLCDAQEAESHGNPNHAEAIRSIADQIDETVEPELRAERMGKFLYGPFEHDYDSIYGYASSRGLVSVRYVVSGTQGQREILLTKNGHKKIEQEILPALEELAWYKHHATIIGKVYKSNDGTTLEHLIYQRFPWIQFVPNLSLIGSYEDSLANWNAR